MGIIYKLTNQITGKSYIGQTIRSIEERWCEHCRDKRWKGHLHNAFQKYGYDCWVKTIVEDDVPLELLNIREQHWIAEYNTFNNGYNSDTGGKNGKQLSEERKQILRKLMIGNTIASREWTEDQKKARSLLMAGNQHLLGHKHSTETKMKMKLNKLGKKRGPYKKRAL
jgi:group I intron endonuclease